MSAQRRSSQPQLPPNPEEPGHYNIIPIDNPVADYPLLQLAEVQAVTRALRAVGDLRKPPNVQWAPHMDLLDWLALFFGFQRDNVRNQREHLVLHLANAQMRLTPTSDNIDVLDPAVLRSFREKLLDNYTSWCSYLAEKSNICISDGPDSSSSANQRRGLLYVSLYLLIWGEAANLRFMPECICFIFHNMAMELNKILEDCIDENTDQPVLPSFSGENAFLNFVVKPIYETIRAEVESGGNGTAPHCLWRNYDDMNEYFWSKRCFQKLKWPIDLSSNFFINSGLRRPVGKTGFVEQRSFWNLFRSFDRLWVMLVLFLQAAIIIAWEEKDYPWQALRSRDVQVKAFTVFFTWSGLRFLKSTLDIMMQYRLVSWDTLGTAVRMVMKSVTAAGWIMVFQVFYGRIWSQRNHDQRWSAEANRRVVNFLNVALVFVAPEILAVVLFIIPWIRNFIKETNWRGFYMLSWWFQSRIFVGRGLQEGLVDKLKYGLFWFVVLVTKFCFSYFLQIKPMITSTKEMLKPNNVHHVWDHIFDLSNELAVGLLWLPVVLTYFMDIQIWYSISSSFVGAGVGLFQHLGEIRNIAQFKCWFHFFASAILFNLIPEEQLLNARGMRNKFRDAIHQLKLRYGFSRSHRTLESNQVMANKFALIWNEIISIFREEDLISDREQELLELPHNSWNVRVIRWPSFLLCNELLRALILARDLGDAPDKWVWHKICENEYRRCAVIEAYDCIKHLLLEIIRRNTEEHSFITNFFLDIDHSIGTEKFTRTFDMTVLSELHAQLIILVCLLIRPQKDSVQVLKTLQAIYAIGTRNFFKDGQAPSNLAFARGFLFENVENVVKLPDPEDKTFYNQVRRLHMILTSRDSMHNIPFNREARRRIAFFSNSLFMNMPRAPRVEKMMALSVLTPYYDEEVMYNETQLRIENEDGISILYYLQTIYADEWENFMERLRREGMEKDEEIWITKLEDVRLWASYRGQTLSRTVRGMMYYYRAFKLLAFLDSASETEIQDVLQELGSMRRDNLNSYSLKRSASVNLLLEGYESKTALMKYTYVVACQIYGTQKAENDPHAEEILYLMKNNEALRVAYVDEVSSGRDKKEYYSVLVKYDHQLEKEVEIYRIKLPGPMMIGGGKPENQNHALIFTRGDAVQTIDMNQDSYFEEALKMRNLLEEFVRYHGIRKPTILGVREYIFTASVSSLAWYMSDQETSFVTVGQRVLANTLKVRMHYGHPDVFDRFWFLTRGGVSKASKVINLCEDIFAGFNCTLRGGNITHHEYIQVGKGRDVGLNQISMFEAKIASGNGEQVLSRDVYRLGHRLDFFRMLSFFHSSVGFFFNAMMVVLIAYVFLWIQLYLTLSSVKNSALANSTANNEALVSILIQQFIIQLGLFTALPMMVETSLELGFLPTVWDFLTMQLQLSSVFYTFSLGTHAHYFGRTILHGGAKYRPTGRGFVVHHQSFAENYRLYARSHFVKAIELGLILIVCTIHSPIASNTFVYLAMYIESLFLILSWIIAPFLFNPSGFDWLKTVNDFDDFMNWIWFRGSVFAKPEQSWENWWYGEQDHLRTTGFWGKMCEIILDLRFFFFQYGIVYRLNITARSNDTTVYLASWIYVFGVLGTYVVVAYAHQKFAVRKHFYFRLVKLLVMILAILVIIVLLLFTNFALVDIFTSLLAIIPTGWGLILIAQVFRPVLQHTIFWKIVVSVARLYDLMFGVIVMAPVALLSWLPGFQSMQTRILFNQAFCRGLRIFQILTGKKSKVNFN